VLYYSAVSAHQYNLRSLLLSGVGLVPRRIAFIISAFIIFNQNPDSQSSPLQLRIIKQQQESSFRIARFIMSLACTNPINSVPCIADATSGTTYTMHKNLSCMTSYNNDSCIMVGAPDSTIDMNGYSLTQDVTGGVGLNTRAIVFFDLDDGAVQNGIINGFDMAVKVSNLV
jgi:hypothetical protein